MSVAQNALRMHNASRACRRAHGLTMTHRATAGPLRKEAPAYAQPIMPIAAFAPSQRVVRPLMDADGTYPPRWHVASTSCPDHQSPVQARLAGKSVLVSLPVPTDEILPLVEDSTRAATAALPQSDMQTSARSRMGRCSKLLKRTSTRACVCWAPLIQRRLGAVCGVRRGGGLCES